MGEKQRGKPRAGPRARAQPEHREGDVWWEESAAVFVLALVAFAPLFFGTWEWQLQYDDRLNFVEQPLFLEPSLASVVEMWELREGKDVETLKKTIGMYEPVALMIKAAVAHVLGLHPSSFLCTAAILHAVVSVLLLGHARALARSLSVQGPVADTATLVGVVLFACHPLRVEVVAWASCFSYVLSALFCTLSLRLHLRCCTDGSSGASVHMAGSWALFALAGLCKSVAVPAAGVAVLTHLLLCNPPLATNSQASVVLDLLAALTRALVLNAPFVLIGLTVGYCQLKSQAHFEISAESGPFLTTFAVSCYSACWYLAKSLPGSTVWGAPLATMYPYPLHGVRLADPVFLVPVVGVVGGLTWIARGLLTTHLRALSVGMRLGVWSSGGYLALLLPSLVSKHGVTVLARDRYSYFPSLILPSILLCAALPFAQVDRLQTRLKHARARLVVAALVAAVLTAETHHTLKNWRQGVSLWEHTASTFPTQEVLPVGDASGELDFAVQAHVLTVSDGLAKLAGTLAHDPANKVNLLKAEEVLQRMLKLHPTSATARRQLARVYEHLGGRPAETESLLRDAIRLNPNDEVNAVARLQLARLLENQKRLGEAQEVLRQAIPVIPTNPEVYFNLGHVLQVAGKSVEAMVEYEKALKLSTPLSNNYLTLLKNMGIGYAGVQPLPGVAPLPLQHTNPKRAVELLKRFLAESKHDPDISELRRLVAHLERAGRL